MLFKKPLVTSFLVAITGLLVITLPVLAEQVDVRVVDNRISLKAEAVGLGELLKILDRVVGTESSVPVELAGRKISVEFANLDFEDAVNKIFEGLSLDYIVVGRQRILVTAVSGVPPNNIGTVSAPNSIATSTLSPPNSPLISTAPSTNPFQLPDFGNQAGSNQIGANPFEAQQPPAMVQTPFGPIPNPRVNENAGGTPLAGPLSRFGQAGFPAGDAQSLGMSSTRTSLPSNQTDTSQPNMFGNTSPTILDLNKQQPASQVPVPQSIPATPPTSSPQQ